MKTITEKFDNWIFNAYKLNPEALGLYRIFYCLTVLFFWGIPDFSWISQYPYYFYTPHLFNIASLFHGFPNYFFLKGLVAAATVLYVMLLFGYKTRTVSIILPLIMFLGRSFEYSFGKIDHDFLKWIVPLVMVFSNWGATFSIDSKISGSKKEVAYWPVAMMALIIGFAMFTAGVPKVMGGWLSMDTEAVRSALFYKYHVIKAQDFMAGFFIGVQSPVFWQFMDITTIIFEIGFLPAIFFPNIFGLLLLIAVSFHFAVALMLNIDFSSNLGAYMLFMNWGLAILALIKLRIPEIISKAMNVKAMIIFMLIYTVAFMYVAQSPANFITNILGLNPLLIPIIGLGVALVIATWNGAYFVLNGGVKFSSGKK